MAMGRNLRVYHNLPNVGPNQSYSLLLENKARGEEYLLIENYAIVSLGKTWKLLKNSEGFKILVAFFPYLKQSRDLLNSKSGLGQ